ncbi:hypothetical protein [Lysobacter sp. CA199]|uniref:hypothetical protein n=1 Tax=Lysobacter sp. CA199 TaxID=3455608 RepID=UPI003F8D5BEE
MKKVLLATLACALMSFASASQAADAPCRQARSMVDRDFQVRDQTCLVAGPNHVRCRETEIAENLSWTAMDQRCPIRTDSSCRFGRMDIDRARATRADICRRANSSNDPACVSMRGNELASFQTYKSVCWND